MNVPALRKHRACETAFGQRPRRLREQFRRGEIKGLADPAGPFVRRQRAHLACETHLDPLYDPGMARVKR